ncbi:cysteine hydrolase family protein [Amycolatopsis solani]|uniref:cysteine hydrolase family protein n=1 Tax=Amycolatopsis solani TaxID=3028615 RepID=UPI00296F04C4|nr:isochorismatase family protein [Amycolatopsis sp. MEP2-6]
MPGSGRRHGPGRRPAVIAVDFQRHFIDAVAAPAVAATAGLLDHARRAGTPVYLVRIEFDDLADADPAWAARFDLSPLLRGAPGTELDPRIGPRHGDVVVDKRHASAFAGTDLAVRLSEEDVDTVLICGLTTSGCVRATAVDAASLGLRVEVVRECVADPRPLSGPVALSDLADRYADVIDLGEAVRMLPGGVE